MSAWPEGSKLRSLMDRGDANNPTTQSGLASALETRKTWQYPFGLACQTEKSYLALVVGRSRKQQQTLMKQRDVFEANLGIERGSALERLLLRSISIAWLRAHFVDRLIAQGEMEDAQAADELAAWRDHAQDQLQNTMERLEMVRKLPKPGTDADESLEGDEQAALRYHRG